MIAERVYTFTVEGSLLTDVRGALPVAVLSTRRQGERTIGLGTHERRAVDPDGAR